MKRSRRSASPRQREPVGYVAECFDGTAPFVAEELSRLPGVAVEKVAAGEIRCLYSGSPADFDRLRLATAVYRTIFFPIPRPKALLGDQHFRRLLAEIETVTARFPPQTFESFRLSAAGRWSAVMQRLVAELEEALGLRPDDEQGDLFLRLRPTAGGWEMLVRLTPRPLTSRPWRLVDMAGALNGPLAALMVDLLALPAGARLFNPFCGSGTLLAEASRAVRKPGRLVGGDLAAEALAAAVKNLRAAGTRAELLQLDGGRLPLPPLSIDGAVADLPWGQLVGSQQAVEQLYPAFLDEMSRVLRPGSPLVVITSQRRLFEETLAAASPRWVIDRAVILRIGSLRPIIYKLTAAGPQLKADS